VRVVLYGVDFGQGHVGGGETGVEADGFEQEGQRLLRLPLHTIEKGQLVKGAWIGGLGGQQGELLVDRPLRLLIQGKVDDVFAEGAHRAVIRIAAPQSDRASPLAALDRNRRKFRSPPKKLLRCPRRSRKWSWASAAPRRCPSPTPRRAQFPSRRRAG